MEECRKNLKLEAEEKPMKGERLTKVKFGIRDLRDSDSRGWEKGMKRYDIQLEK